MHALAPILAAMATAATDPPRVDVAGPGVAVPAAAHATADEVSWRESRPHVPENLLAGPARCALRYLEAVRRAGPHPEKSSGRLPAPRERDYAAVRALTAPRTLEEIDRRAAAGEDHPLAPWREAARAHVLESFQLVAVRRAPLGAAVVTVAENFWRPPGADLERAQAEYLVARVHGEWKVVDRSPGQAFDDGALRERYAGFFDDPAPAR